MVANFIQVCSVVIKQLLLAFNSIHQDFKLIVLTVKIMAANNFQLSVHYLLKNLRLQTSKGEHSVGFLLVDWHISMYLMYDLHSNYQERYKQS